LSFLIPACSTFNTHNAEPGYYRLINEKTAGEEVRITTIEGNDFKGKNLSISKDSTSWINIMKLKSSIRMSSVKDVKYTTGGYNNTAVIELTDGNVLKASDIDKHDSIVTFFNEQEIPYITATENIRKVSIKSHFLGAISGFGLG